MLVTWQKPFTNALFPLSTSLLEITSTQQPLGSESMSYYVVPIPKCLLHI